MGNNTMKKQLFKRITDQVSENLKNSKSWQKLWEIRPPVSLKGHIYQGINQLLLADFSYQSPVWGTFNQIRQNGGTIRKGEESFIVVFWKRLVNTDVDPKTGKPVENISFMLRYYNVFNTEQCDFDKLGQDTIRGLTNVSESAHNERITKADHIVQQYVNGPQIQHGQFNPCYIPSKDTVKLPPIAQFHHSDAYYSALFHELVHSTGHESRLARIKEGHNSNEHDYSKEELVAELGSAYLCTISGIKHDMDNTTAYVKSWLTALENNPSWITWAASQAQKACLYIHPEKLTHKKAS